MIFILLIFFLFFTNSACAMKDEDITWTVQRVQICDRLGKTSLTPQDINELKTGADFYYKRIETMDGEKKVETFEKTFTVDSDIKSPNALYALCAPSQATNKSCLYLLMSDHKQINTTFRLDSHGVSEFIYQQACSQKALYFSVDLQESSSKSDCETMVVKRCNEKLPISFTYEPYVICKYVERTSQRPEIIKWNGDYGDRTIKMKNVSMQTWETMDCASVELGNMAACEQKMCVTKGGGLSFCLGEKENRLIDISVLVTLKNKLNKEKQKVQLFCDNEATYKKTIIFDFADDRKRYWQIDSQDFLKWWSDLRSTENFKQYCSYYLDVSSEPIMNVTWWQNEKAQEESSEQAIIEQPQEESKKASKQPSKIIDEWSKPDEELPKIRILMSTFVALAMVIVMYKLRHYSFF